MAKKSFAPRVTNFSISCDPAMLDWLDDYAIKNSTSRSRVVRRALIDFRAEHKDAPDDGTPPVLDPERRCVICDAMVIRVPGVAPICTVSSAHEQNKRFLTPEEKAGLESLALDKLNDLADKVGL